MSASALEARPYMVFILKRLVYLALALSGYITGVALSVDGGFVSSGVIEPG